MKKNLIAIVGLFMMVNTVVGMRSSNALQATKDAQEAQEALMVVPEHTIIEPKLPTCDVYVLRPEGFDQDEWKSWGKQQLSGELCRKLKNNGLKL